MTGKEAAEFIEKMTNKEAAEVLKNVKFWMNGGRRNGKIYLSLAYDKALDLAIKALEERSQGEPLDNKMTTLVTLSDGWDHVREAYYDKGRQLVFTEWFSVKDLDSRYININERKELSDSEEQKND